MLAIFKKEFKNYFLSPIGYIFVGVFTILASMFKYIFIFYDYIESTYMI